MDIIDSTTSAQQTIPGAIRNYRRPNKAGVHDTAVMRVRNFIALMKIIGEHDLWDALEADMATEACASLRISAQPLRITSAMLRRKVRHGDLPANTPGLYARCSSLGGNTDEEDAAEDAGVEAGRRAARLAPLVLPMAR